ncbi:death domain-containing immune deficiency protein [Musca autumnalis]|uniref:death domain-containing immune deficiency protein n=1 Tax=Musca autumnalis TaxID=221902 RepID=UPI003CEBAA05
MDFNKNSESKSEEGTYNEKDAAPVNISEETTALDVRQNTVSDRMPQLSQHNAINVHNDNQRVLMQISNVNSVHLGHIINMNSGSAYGPIPPNCDKVPPSKKGSSKTNKFNKKTTTIDLMMNSLERPTHKIIDTAATHLGAGWKEVMRMLGFSDGQISQSELDNHLHGTKETIYQLLQDWVRNADDEACTIGYLTNVLWKSGQCECVYRMKNVYKSEFVTRI